MVAALTVSDVSKSYGPTRALDRASLTVERGTIHALLGGNGSGKSTLIKILAGVVKGDSGTVAIGDAALEASAITPARAAAARCFFVHQDAGVFPELSVADNLHLGQGFETTGLQRIKWRAVRRRTREILERYEISAAPETLVADLGPATQAKLAIARALQGTDGATDSVLVLDEPTAPLPAHEVAHLLTALRRYADAGQSIVFVTHRLAEVCEIADRATVLRNGRVLADLERHEITPERLTDLIAGGPESADPPARGAAPEDAPPLLRVTGLSGGRIEDCSLDLRGGEILGLAGLTGSGRTTLLQLLFGLIPRRSGEVTLSGERLAPRGPRDAMAADLAYVPADRKRDGLFPGLSVSENLAMAVVPRYWRHGWLRRGDEQSDSRTLIAEQGIKTESERLAISALSGGNQQKVMLARWLRREPKVLLLDEPTQGVDIGARRGIHDLLRAVVQPDVGAIVASSDEDELAAVCDRVLVLRDGRICAELTAQDLTAERIARFAHADPPTR
ncbi:Ribose ABC transport system ATP-binding protein RbsA (TC 3.A.1.2.1) [Patulibacter medicamentivorans]|uniref:Ribose ABC transport system ATP-binding protein RbsA (TC 3.A.1.2.1) n=1 Tax=Patulibacter medicamentivorans TaxID=1097667 RepID=H0E1P2_9ACTN|nr:Ribose ABC transport system ATP-binding protein RbsA (TC 3.A.1.2.1) [Patulibacter medicamentivorans]